MRTHLALLVALLWYPSGCNPADAAQTRIRIFADRHGPHLQAIALEFAPRCAGELASLAPDGEPGAAGKAASQAALPFGSLVQDQSVEQVAVICANQRGVGTIIASLRDPSSEGGSVSPPSGCTDYQVTTATGDTLVGCYDPQRASRTSIRMQAPIAGGTIEVVAITKLLLP